MAFSASTPFPYQITPLTNIVPFTYRDGTTYLETLERLRVWLNNSLVPEFNAGIDNAIKEFLRGIENAENRVVESEVMHKKLISDTLISVAASVKSARDYVDRITELVNNKTGNMDIQRVALKATTTTFAINELWPTNHPVFVSVKQDSTGNRKITFPANVRGIVDLKTEPNSVTEFTLFPDGAGNWDIVQYAGTLAGQITDATISAIMRRRNTGTDAALNDKIAETILNVRLFGLKGDGTTDDTAAFNALIASLPEPTNTFGLVSPAIYFPAGRYILDGSFVFEARLTIKGAGPNQTILNRKPGATGDFITLNGPNSVIRDMTIDGSRYNGTSGDNLVMNNANQCARHLIVANSGGNGISLGKGGRALNHRVESLSCNSSALIGIQIYGGKGSTDGKWINVGVGASGKQGVRIDEAAQQLVNVHSWGNGTEATGASEGAGFYISSSSNTFSNCQSESNWFGIAVFGSQSTDNAFNGCNVWGNRSNGLYIYEADGGIWQGCKVHKNGVNNTGTSSPSFAGIRNTGGSYWTFGANRSFDTGRAIPPGTYTNEPTSPYPGRAASVTQTHHYFESEGTNRPNHNTVSGNTWRSQETRTGISAVTLGSTSVWSGNSLGLHAVPTLTADGSTLTPHAEHDVFKVDGTGSINNITPTYAGRKLTVIFVSPTPGNVWNGTGNLKLSDNFKPHTNATLSLISDGTDWYETGRSSAIVA